MNNGVQFINGYQWVDTYYNGLKIAGSQLVDVSGDILIVPNTYNDSAYLKILGKTIEVGTGDKSPDNPYELQSVGDDGGFDLVSVGNAGQLQTVHIPYTLRGQGDVRDTVEYLGGNTWKYTQKWGRKVFDGTETLNASTGSSNEEYFGVYTLFESAAVAPPIRRGYCSHGGVWTIGVLSWNSVGSGFIYNFNPSHFLRVPRAIASSIEEIRSFLTAEHAAGTPWTVEYELAEPIITYFTAPAPQTFYPFTQIYTTATVQPTLDGKFRVWGS